MAQDNISLDNVTFLSSPFLRTLQTTHELIQALDKVPQLPSKTKLKDVKILPEYSVFEWDGKGGEWHKSLPPIQERAHYFPRLQVNHTSLFVPEIPEPRSEFHNRCEKAVQALSNRYSYQQEGGGGGVGANTALVVVTHAAACIGLCRAAIRGVLADITPAAPCSVYRLTRTSDTQVWEMDAHDKKPETTDTNSSSTTSVCLNGHSDHLSDLGSKTVPWNHFGDKKIHKGYTGPPASRFAPKEVREEL